MLLRSRLVLVVSVALLAGCSGGGSGDDPPPLADSSRPPPAPSTKSGPDPKGAGTTGDDMGSGDDG